MNRNLSEQIEFVFAALNKLEISAPCGSRLDRLARVFRAYDGSWTMNVPFGDAARFELALESRREFQLFEYILDPWEFGRKPVPFEKLQLAVLKDDPLQYAQAKRMTKGRDTQLELQVATAFQRSGAGAEMLAPRAGTKYPDVRTRACNRGFFIEVKRVKSRAAVVDAIAKAVEQINAAGCPGAAFVDVTMAFNEENLRANELLRRDQLQPVFRDWLQEQFEPLRTDVDAVTQGSKLTSIFLQSHLLVPIAGTVELYSTILTYPECVTGRYAREDEDMRRSLDFGWTRR
ncbi:MAG: hypothetical protein ACKVWV_12065 [Planctomycetota bacterium]